LKYGFFVCYVIYAMARPLRIEYPGAVYHITTRGNAQNNIFRDDQDRENFLDILNETVKRHNWLCHAYCLMNNHYHLLIETPEANLSLGMRQINGVYTQRYNKRHKQVGHVFQGRYKAILVDKENYLLELCRYVVLNPVRAGLVELPEHWQWGSYLPTAGFTEVPEFLTVDWILGMFGTNRQDAQRHYREFVRVGLSKKSPWDNLDGQVLLGSKNFVEQLKDLLQEKEGIKEIPRHQRFASRPTLEEIFAACLTKYIRNERIYEAHVKHGYSLMEISDFLGIHYSTISKIVRKMVPKS